MFMDPNPNQCWSNSQENKSYLVERGKLKTKKEEPDQSPKRVKTSEEELTTPVENFEQDILTRFLGQ